MPSDDEEYQEECEHGTQHGTKALVVAWREGDEDARNELLASVQQELSAIAGHLLRDERRRISIMTDDLVNEAIVKLLQTEVLKINDRAHLLALCANVMRHTLIDAARRRQRGKRKALIVTLATGVDAPVDLSVDLLALEHALLRLKAIDAQSADLVEMRYFGGMSLDDIAEVLDVSPSTVQRLWRVARAWLKEAMQRDG